MFSYIGRKEIYYLRIFYLCPCDTNIYNAVLRPVTREGQARVK